jgi:hypothetical protein
VLAQSVHCFRCVDECSTGAMQNHVRSFAGVPKKGTQFVQIFSHTSQLSHCKLTLQAKVLWTAHVSTITVFVRIDDRIVSR